MEYDKITAIVRTDCLEKVERKLQDMGVKGITVTHVKGYGEYANFFRRDWEVRSVRFEIFTLKGRTKGIVDAILDAACTGTSGDGIVAVLPVEAVYRIRTRSKASPGDV